MPDPMTPETFLDACTVDEAVFELRPDYRALLLVVDGLTPPASGAVSYTHLTLPTICSV